MAKERKEKLIRVLQILETTDSKSPLNATQIVDRLESEYNLDGIDRKSIYRDVKLLQSCGYPIDQKSDKRLGWYMREHAFEDWEIKIMMDAVQQARCISVDEAKDIRERLLRITSKRGRSRFSHLMMPLAGNVNVDEKIGHYIETMLEAMFMHKKVVFQYTEIDDEQNVVLRKEGREYVLNLYEIYWSDNNYYMIGAHDNHSELVSYRLDRVVNMKMSEEYAIDARDRIGENAELKIQDYIKKSVNHFIGDTIKVEVEYEPSQKTNAILYDFAGKDAQVVKLDNGRCRASFYKAESVTLTRWFMQYAGMFTAVGPEKLRKEIFEKIKNALDEYK